MKSLFGLLDIAGIALIGLVGVLAVSPKGQIQNYNLFGNALVIEPTPRLIALLMLAVFVLYSVKAIFSLSLTRIISRLLASIDTKMANEATAYYFLGPYSQLRNRSKTDVQWTLTESVVQAFFVTLGAFSSIVGDLIALILVVILLIGVDPIACCFVVGYFAVISFFVQKFIGNKQLKIGQQHSVNSRKTLNAIEDSYVAYRENFVQRLMPFSLQRIGEFRRGMSIGIGKTQFLGVVPRLISEVSLMLGIVAFVAWQFVTGSLEEGVGVIAVFLAAGVRIMGAIGPLQNALASLKNASSQSELAREAIQGFQKFSTENLQVGLDSNPSHNHSTTTSSTGYKIDVRNVTFRYLDSEKNNLNDISINIEGGNFAAIIGPSGAGKTTLIDLILGLYEPISGEVLIENQNVKSLLDSRPGTVSYVPQRPGLISGSIRENITLFTPDHLFDRTSFDEAIEIAQLGELLASLPGGENYVVDNTNAKISGGQIQRIGLARALYRRPRLLILDEATSALDADSEFAINTAIQSLRPFTTVLVVAHRLSTVQKADTVYLVEDGNVTAKGSFSELRRFNPLVEKYVQLMSFDK